MKVLIAGGNCSFYELLIDRLKREKHEVYTISGKKSNSITKKCINYDIELTDEKLSYIFYSAMPDVVIFLGAFDDNYDFSNEQKASMSFYASLSNLLITMSSMSINKFIYLSTSAVYGTKYNMSLTESMKTKPEDIKSLIISEGEAMCLNFQKISNLRMSMLRISDVYGIFTGKSTDLCDRIFIEAMDALQNDRPFLPLTNRYLSPVYVSDVVDAIYKTVIADKDETDIYNISAQKTELSYIYEKIGELIGLPISADTEDINKNINNNITNINENNNINENIVVKNVEKHSVILEEVIYEQPVNLCVDHSLISERLGYRPLVDIDNGLIRMHQSITKQSDNKKEKIINKREKNKILQLLTPFLENILVFAVIAAISIFVGSNIEFLSGNNFMILYIVIISMTFGLFQASLSIVFACVFILWQMISNGTNAFDALINLETLSKVLELIIIGIICGHAKDSMSTKIYEKDLELEDNKKELETIYKINDSNIKIKRTLDDRLVNYEDSLAKIYSIVDRLNSLQPDAVFFSAIDVIMEIMNSNDVSIYIVTGGDFKMCRLIAKTPSSMRMQKKSIAFSDLGELSECLERNEIYINRNLDENMPMMAAPIFSQQTLVSIIMLWSLEFENLTIYNTNRFLVLSQLISSAIERAYVYMQNMNDSMYLPETSILKTEAFEKILNIHKEAAKLNTSTYEMILIDNSKSNEGSAFSLKELSLKIRSLLRSTDYVGQCRDDKNKLVILLTNTNIDDCKFVYDRLIKVGLTCSPYSIGY